MANPWPDPVASQVSNLNMNNDADPLSGTDSARVDLEKAMTTINAMLNAVDDGAVVLTDLNSPITTIYGFTVTSGGAGIGMPAGWSMDPHTPGSGIYFINHTLSTSALVITATPQTLSATMVGYGFTNNDQIYINLDDQVGSAVEHPFSVFMAVNV